MHVNEEILHEEIGGKTWGTLYRCCMMRKVVCKEVTARGRFWMFSGFWLYHYVNMHGRTQRDTERPAARPTPTCDLI